MCIIVVYYIINFVHKISEYYCISWKVEYFHYLSAKYFLITVVIDKIHVLMTKSSTLAWEKKIMRIFKGALRGLRFFILPKKYEKNPCTFGTLKLKKIRKKSTRGHIIWIQGTVILLHVNLLKPFLWPRCKFNLIKRLV